MISPLSIATKGRLGFGSVTKKTLMIASLGLLVITITTPPEPRLTIRGGGGKTSSRLSVQNSVILQRLQEEDLEVLSIIKTFLAAQNRK